MKKETDSFVYIDLPRAGLGNKMTVWARGMVFAKINELPVYTSKWWHFSIGPLLRGEVKSRWYFNYFIHKYIRGAFLFLIARRNPKFTIIEEPMIGPNEVKKPLVFLFRKHIYEGVNNADLYRDLKDHRAFIIAAFLNILSHQVKKELMTLKPATIGVHVRRGDFKNMAWDVTSNQYFKHIIEGIRAITGKELSCKIYSDGTPDELKDLLKLTNTEMACNSSDIADLIELSRSKFIVYSKGSSFSNWAGFLSEAHIIHPPREDKVIPCRHIDKFEDQLPESTSAWPERFLKILKAL